MDNRIDSGFRERVYVVVAQIPKGRVMTYGQIAALCGNPRAARIVGFVASGTKFEHHHRHAERSDLDGVQGSQEKRVSRMHNTVNEASTQLTQQSAKSTGRVSGSTAKQARATCPLCDLPWQRVVKKDGRLAEGYPGGVQGHKEALEAEGVQFSSDNRVSILKYLWHLAD